ncbi:hypothetical protein EV1_045381 [Malus domestica]
MVNCTQLEFLHIGNNKINDIFPSWLGVLPVLRSMLPSKYMENWNFIKYVVANEGNHYFYVSSNVSINKYENYYRFSFDMIIPVKGVELTYHNTPFDLRLIDFSSNRFEGKIPASIIGSLRELQLLNLSNNGLSGHIPHLWGT